MPECLPSYELKKFYTPMTFSILIVAHYQSKTFLH